MITVKEEIIDKISENIYYLLKGNEPKQIELPQDYPENEIMQAVTYINKFFKEYNELNAFLAAMAKGELDFSRIKSRMSVAQSFKSLRSNLKHLTWNTQKIAEGDFNHKIDFMGDFSEAFNKMTQQLKDAFEKIEQQNKELTKANEIISQEKEKSEKLLLNILPLSVMDDLKKYGKSEPQIFENVSVYFSDIVGFTKQSSSIEPILLIAELNKMFTVFDDIMTENHCERIKTIGDAYLAVCGMPTADADHAKNIINAAIGIRDYMLNNQKSSIQWKIRIGIHTGKVVGGVVGIKKYIYDIFGDAINTASRMESNSEPMKINVSEASFNLLNEEYHFIERDVLNIKGKGDMKMFFLDKKI